MPKHKKEILESQKVSIETAMERFNTYLYVSLGNTEPYYKDIVQHLCANKGKQLRSKLSLLCACLTGELNESSYRAATIVEMLHTASLLHDDIVDNSMERRGAPSINSKWGTKIALLSGDIISLRALLLLFSHKNYNIFEIYGNAVEQIVEGELIQLRKTRQLNTNEETYFRIIKAKTAALFSAACKAGASTTTENKEYIENLAKFGENLGIAFQIRDDLFSFGSKNVGKPNDNDFKEKKLTLPIIFLLNKMSFAKRYKLKHILKKKNVQSTDIEWIKEEVKKCGGLDYTVAKMKEYGQKAIDIIDGFPNSEYKDELKKIAKYAIERTY